MTSCFKPPSHIGCFIWPFWFAVVLRAAEPVAPNWLVIANDQTISYATGAMSVVSNPGAGSVSLLALGTNPPVLRHLAPVPVSVIGPPTSIALHPTRSLAIVTRAMQAEVRGGKMQHVPGRQVSLVNLAEEGGGVITTVAVGLQPSSVSISPDGSYALVTNRSDGTLSVLGVTETSLQERERVTVAKPEDSLAHVEISPDGKLGLVTLNKANEVLLLSLDLQGHPTVIDRVSKGSGPYAARFLPDGRGAAIANVVSNEVVFLSIKPDGFQVIESVQVGWIPEGIDVSPDGEWIAVSCVEGGNQTDKTHPSYGRPGQVYLLRRNGHGYSQAGILEVGGGPQAAVFSPDGNFLLVANTGAGRLLLFRREAEGFVNTGQRWSVPGEPISIRRAGGAPR